MKDQLPWCSGHPRVPRKAPVGQSCCGGASTLSRSLGSQQETSPWLRRTDLPACRSLMLSLPHSCGRQHPQPRPSLPAPGSRLQPQPLPSPVLVAPWTVALNVNTCLRPHCNPAGSPPTHIHTHTCTRAHTQAHACAWSPDTLGDTGLGTATKQQLWCPWSPCPQSGRTGHIF